MRFIFLCSALLAVAYSSQTFAFGRTGHQQICQLAYQQATAQTRQQIDMLLQFKPGETFAKGCVWPDEARNEPAFSYSKPHHFINVKRDARKVEHKDCASAGCLLSAIRHHSAVLKTTENSLQKLQSLLFLSHFVADLHQPLHVSYADDLGGNKTAVYFLKQPGNLHGVWDSGLLRALGYEENEHLLQQKFADVATRKIRSWQHGDALFWANESLTQTRKVYQAYRPGMLLDEQAVLRDGPVVETRMLQAAVRLAWLLDKLFTAPAAAADPVKASMQSK
ncbi:S1/P1 nuclease [Rheinheimera sp. 4Y26]|uniref:S1/P1 nuclease n=1 Tax=Rheinheimera sp. 4Y26 TaxID=2977811 RepID=UPI0021B0A976|nr:S1/P1 nuclease [Rheinheimera sp. 4Y26]MCT6700022.1 S1/P1 nuclease [Rheinheimera sp. 4Y26]